MMVAMTYHRLTAKVRLDIAERYRGMLVLPQNLLTVVALQAGFAAYPTSGVSFEGGYKAQVVL
jgi:hypothetical protein